jgi:cytochrome c553
MKILLPLFLALLWAEVMAADESAREHYMLHCQGCHLADATGREPYVPNMVNQIGRYLAVPGGRAYLVQVPGTAHSPLTDAEIAELLNWALHEFSAATVPADFRPYTAAEVAGYRGTRPADILARRRTLLAALRGPVPISRVAD